MHVLLSISCCSMLLNKGCRGFGKKIEKEGDWFASLFLFTLFIMHIFGLFVLKMSNLDWKTSASHFSSLLRQRTLCIAYPGTAFSFHGSEERKTIVRIYETKHRWLLNGPPFEKCWRESSCVCVFFFDFGQQQPTVTCSCSLTTISFTCFSRKLTERRTEHRKLS
jgi:hypothetical protein